MRNTTVAIPLDFRFTMTTTSPESTKRESGESVFLEVRPGKIATDAKLIARKSIGVIYSVWFVGNASITINIGTRRTMRPR
jgi:hypothetical protein